MTQEELQQMLDSFQKEVTKKDWQIDNSIRLTALNKDREIIERKSKIISKSLKNKYKSSEVMRNNLLKGGKKAKGKTAHNAKLSDYQVEWVKQQYNRKRDIFGKKIGYQRLANALGVSLYPIQTIIRGLAYNNTST